MLTVAALMLFLQEPPEHSIPILEKERYLKLAKRCKEAEGFIDSRPGEAAQILDSVLGDVASKGLDKVECRLKIEEQRSLWKKYDFFPYQYRGRALMAMADRSNDLDSKRKLMESAAADLNESFTRRGLASSRAYFEEAKAKLKKLSDDAPGEDPEVKFKALWRGFISKSQFVQARKHVQSEGGFLSAEKRRKYLEDTERECLDSLALAVEPFLANLEKVRNRESLRAMSRATFDQRFELPERRELVAVTPAYDWCVEVRATLERMRGGEEALDALFDHAVAAVPLGARSFEAVEAMAYELVREGIEARAEESRSAPAQKRTELLSQAKLLQRKWQGLDARVRRADGEFAKRIAPRDFAPLFERFPLDDEDVNKVVAAIQASAEAEDPDRALEEAESALGKMSERWERLSIESRRAILTYRIVAGALRGFLAGRSDDEVLRDLRKLGTQLKDAGGTFEVKGFGPRVEKVVRRLP